VLGSSQIRRCLVFSTLVGSVLLSSGTLHGLPIKLKIEDAIKEAKKPVVNYPPARAGWNGPEAKSAMVTLNPTYERLRYLSSPAAARIQFLQAAKPDWRLLLCVGAVIFLWRIARGYTRELPHAARPMGNVVAIDIRRSPTLRDERVA
jgi:hypothetical protein